MKNNKPIETINLNGVEYIKVSDVNKIVNLCIIDMLSDVVSNMSDKLNVKKVMDNAKNLD